MKRLPNIHPGEILFEDFMLPFGLSAYRVAKDTGIPQSRISQIIKGKRSITAGTALRFSAYFGTSAELWLGLQNEYDLEEEKRSAEKTLDEIKRLKFSVCSNDLNKKILNSGKRIKQKSAR